MKKRILSIVLTLCMVLTLVPAISPKASAAEYTLESVISDKTLKVYERVASAPVKGGSSPVTIASNYAKSGSYYYYIPVIGSVGNLNIYTTEPYFMTLGRNSEGKLMDRMDPGSASTVSINSEMTYSPCIFNIESNGQISVKANEYANESGQWLYLTHMDPSHQKGNETFYQTGLFTIGYYYTSSTPMTFDPNSVIWGSLGTTVDSSTGAVNKPTDSYAVYSVDGNTVKAKINDNAVTYSINSDGNHTFATGKNNLYYSWGGFNSTVYSISKLDFSVKNAGSVVSSFNGTLTLKQGGTKVSDITFASGVATAYVPSGTYNLWNGTVDTGVTITADSGAIDVNQYSVSVGSGPHMSGAYINNFGNTSYSGLNGASVAISGGTADTGYQFDKWTVSSGTAPTWEAGKTAADSNQTITIKGTTVLTATSKLNAPTITVTGKNGAGTTTSSTIYEDTITITATPSHDLASGLTYTYQWYKGGTAEDNKISSATNPTLLLSTVSDSGDYYCKVTAVNQDATPLTASGFSAKATVIIRQKPVAFTVTGTSQTYQAGTARNITIADTGTENLSANDFAVKYYKVDEDNGVLNSQTPVANAISIGRYLYVIDFAASLPNYTISRKFTVSSATLPTIANYDNVGYLDIKAGTEQQQPISFESGSVNKYVADGTFTNPLTNPNGTTASYQSSNMSVAAVASDGTVTIKAAGSATITATSNKDGMAPVYASYTLNVSKEPITVTVSNKTTVYGDAPPYTDISALSFSKTISASDYVSSGLTFSGYTQGRSAGEYTITAKGLTSDKYSFIYESGTLTVTPMTLTAGNFSVTAQDKTYDGTNSAFVSASFTGLYGSDTLGVTASSSFADAAVGSGKTVNYTITDLTGAKAVNYALSGGSITGTATASISQAVVTVSCQSQSANFDGEAKTIPLTAYVDGKLFTAYQVTYNGSTTAPSAVGDYTIGIDLTDKTNYTVNSFSATLTIKTAGQDSFDVTGVPDTVTYGDADFKLTAMGNTTGSVVSYAVTAGSDYASVSGDTVSILKPGMVTITATSKLSGYADKTKTVTFTVKKKAVTVTAKAQTITYGDAFTSVTNGYTVTGSVTGKDVTGTATYSTNYTETKGAGSYLITPSGLTSEYYSFIYEPGTLTVNPKNLTADDFTVSVKDKEYDGTTSADFTISVNAVSGDVLTGVYSGAFSSSNAAYTVNASCIITGVTGPKADSYMVGSSISKSATARIFPMPITFTFGTTTYLYDGQQKAVTVSAVDSKNRVFSDFTVKYDESTTPPSAVGDYAVKAVLANATNYTSSSNTATLTITKGNVVVWASSGTSQKYDGTAKYITAMSAPNVPTTVTYYAITSEGKVSDIVSAPTAVGRYLYVITQTDPNYKIKNAVEVLSGDAVTGLIGSNFGILEIAENVQPTLSFENPLVNTTYGDTPFIKTSRGGAIGAIITYASSDVSIVTVDNNGKITIVKPGLATITATAHKDGFGDVKATYAVQISKKAVTLSLDAETCVTYKGENWIVPYHLTGDIDGNKLGVADITFTYTDQSDPNKHTPKNTGTYLATVQVKADNEYYTSGQATGLLKITPAPLTVTADDKTVTYGDIAPAYTVSYTPVGGDTYGCLDGTALFDCSYKQFDNKGTYSITPSALSSANYEITFKAGTLTVNPKTVTLSWSKDSLPYNGTEQAVAAIVGGLLNGDTANVTTYTGNKQTAVSTGYSAEATALDNANYTLTGSSNLTHSWSITAVAPSIELSNITTAGTGSPITIGAARVTGVGSDGDITSGYSVTYTYYTDAACLTQTTTADGASLSGGAPSEDGTYYVKAEISAQGNYIGAAATATLTIFTPSTGGGVGGGGGGIVTPAPTQPEVIIPKIIGGQITLNPSKPTEGDNVIITVTPDKGYTDGGVTVKDGNGNSIPVNKNSDGTYSFAMPNVAITVTPKFNIETVKNPFKDVPDNAYYYDAVIWAVEKGITGGTGDGNFSPNNISTRAQTVTFLWRAMGSPEPTTTVNPFTDMSSDAYYFKAVLWAVEKGITLGTSGNTFSPNAVVTRSQTVTFLWRTAGKPTAAKTKLFGDVEGDAYYANAVLWAVSESITSGTSASTFSPADGCTRAQIVIFLYRYFKK